MKKRSTAERVRGCLCLKNKFRYYAEGEKDSPALIFYSGELEAHTEKKIAIALWLGTS